MGPGSCAKPIQAVLSGVWWVGEGVVTTGLVIYLKGPEWIVVEGGYISQVTIQLSLACLNPKVKVHIVFSLKVYRTLDNLYVLENEPCAYKLITEYS